MLNPEELLRQLGPLAHLVGVWDGDKGDDIAPSDDRGTENNRYREIMTFETMGPIQNHEQNLHVLRYSTRIYRLGEEDTFHEELGVLELGAGDSSGDEGVFDSARDRIDRGRRGGRWSERISTYGDEGFLHLWDLR